DIESACKKHAIKIGKTVTVKEGYLIRLNPFTSQKLLIEKFTVNSRYKPNHSTYFRQQDTSYNNSNTYNNIIDVSTRGQKDKKNKAGADVINMMKLLPAISELSRQEVHELGVANGWWKRQ